jgi:hypothetical protein
MTVRSSLCLGFVGVALIAAGCDSKGGGAGDELDVTLHQDGIELSSSDVPPGDLAIIGTNEGSETHEFELFAVPDGVDVGDLPMDGDVARADENLEVIDEVEDIAPGTSAQLSVSLDPGEYAVICNLPGHYARGMHATFTVG